jgi:hypothetical protein
MTGRRQQRIPNGPGKGSEVDNDRTRSDYAEGRRAARIGLGPARLEEIHLVRVGQGRKANEQGHADSR